MSITSYTVEYREGIFLQCPLHHPAIQNVICKQIKTRGIIGIRFKIVGKLPGSLPASLKEEKISSNKNCRKVCASDTGLSMGIEVGGSQDISIGRWDRPFCISTTSNKGSLGFQPLDGIHLSCTKPSDNRHIIVSIGVVKVLIVITD